MAFRIRRVVTGHDANGKSVIASDGTVESTPGNIDKAVSGADVWWTHSIPVDVLGHDASKESTPRMPTANGTLLKILEISPGSKPVMHKTETLDYAIVLEGEVDMLLDDGAEVHLDAGDMLIQRGTLHAWENRGARPCRIAFFLVAARR
jgi:hypothetical protein